MEDGVLCYPAFFCLFGVRFGRFRCYMRSAVALLNPKKNSTKKSKEFKGDVFLAFKLKYSHLKRFL